MYNIYNFCKYPMFYYICDPFMTFAKFSFDKAKNTSDYKNLISIEVNFFEHMVSDR